MAKPVLRSPGDDLAARLAEAAAMLEDAVEILYGVLKETKQKEEDRDGRPGEDPAARRG